MLLLTGIPKYLSLEDGINVDMVAHPRRAHQCLRELPRVRRARKGDHVPARHLLHHVLPKLDVKRGALSRERGCAARCSR